MFANILNPQKRAASRELDVGLCYLLHGAKELVPLLRKTYRDKWSGFIDDILNGARPYEVATVVILVFLRQSFKQDLNQETQGAPSSKALLTTISSIRLTFCE
jgi:hypothetical protein